MQPPPAMLKEGSKTSWNSLGLNIMLFFSYYLSKKGFPIKKAPMNLNHIIKSIKVLLIHQLISEVNL
jgi:hypothetical protein